MTESLPDPDGTSEAGAPDDGTLGGYRSAHDRPPAFEGSDGHPYTVSIEVERTGDLRAPYLGYLVFPRWAQTGVGIIGHVESGILVRARTAQEAEAHLGGMSLLDVRETLEEALARVSDAPTLSPRPHAP
ncbi:MAG: hypothetical protein P8170_01405 [Gemmatimonadota bacterium]|jgi:hypothetical protein